MANSWYEGDDKSIPVGTGEASLRTPSLTQDKHYWVHVSNVCGEINSDTATVTVLPDGCYSSAITLQDRFFSSGLIGIFSDISISTQDNVTIGPYAGLRMKSPWLLLGKGFQIQAGGELYYEAGSASCN